MANQNTIAGVYNLTQGNITTESAFPTLNPLGAQSPSLRAVIALPASYTTAAQPNEASLPGYTAGVTILNTFESKLLRIRAAAKVTGGTTTNFTLKVYANLGGNTNLTTFTNDTNLMTSGAVAVNSTTKTFVLDALVVWDNVGARIDGSFQIQAGSSYTSPATLSNAATSVTFPWGLFATGLFSAGNASNAVTLTELVIDQV